MSFSSFEYLFIFLPLAVCVYFALGARARVAKAWLLLASVAFYARGGLFGLPYLFASVALNFWLGRRIAGASALSRKHLLLRVGLATNVGLLVAVKYRMLLLSSVGLAMPGAAAPVPAGISFFTLVQIMYLIDCFDGLTSPNTAFDHLLFTSYFPYVMMGPLVRTRDVRPLLGGSAARRVDYDAIAAGIEQICIGLFKKVVFAQSFGFFVDTGWSRGRPLTLVEAWLTTVAFAFELYFDFSGYSDMAVGVALMFGVKLPANFDSPYKSTSMIAFWRRWHITLSNFITTYIYTPLLRMRRRPSFAWAMSATVFTMAVAGLWHGAEWTFLIFGLVHGLALAINHLWRKTKRPFPKLLGWLLTFGFLVCSLVLFRAPSLAGALEMFRAMAGAGQVRGLDTEAFLSGSTTLVRVAVAIVGVAVCFFAPNSNAIALSFSPSRRRALIGAVAMLIALVFMNSLSAKEFIYRDF